MSSIRRVGVASVVVAGIVWAGLCFATPELNQTASQGKPTGTSVAVHLSDAGPLLAARYHLRSRTKRFFQRSSGRSRRVRRSRGIIRRIGSTSRQEPYLAARYHLRGRTNRFFQRSTHRGHPVHSYYRHRPHAVPVQPKVPSKVTA